MQIYQLESDYRTLRGKVKALLDKSDADDHLIDSLKQEIEQKKTNTLRLGMECPCIRCD
jgi:hypothetical protein